MLLLNRYKCSTLVKPGVYQLFSNEMVHSPDTGITFGWVLWMRLVASELRMVPAAPTTLNYPDWKAGGVGPELRLSGWVKQAPHRTL
jgi:hypothetical protein